MKKAFTLIEVIGVVIILGIIAVISILAISGLVKNESKNISDALKEIVYLANETYMYSNDKYEINEGNVYCVSILDLKSKGLLSDPVVDPVTGDEITDDIFVETKVVNSKYSFNIVDTCTEVIAVNQYVDSTLNGGKVVLGDGMIPVTIETDGTVKVADTTTEWYNYTDSLWANAVTVIDSESHYRTDVPGTVIDMTAIYQMYVYIPRYKYEVFYTDSDTYTINVEFEPKSSITGREISLNTDPATLHGTSTFITHPAFYYEENGNTVELDGIWVGKFEQAEDNKIVPNVNSMNNLNVSTLFSNITSVNGTNGLTSGVSEMSVGTTDVHMLKNMEWGAVAYLSQSIYGICSSASSCPEKVQNNDYYESSTYNILTGCGGDDTANTGTCPEANRWNTNPGMQASTTHNITGIYDTAGGRWEYVMGNMHNSSNQFSSSSARFTTNPSTKYYDAYTYGTSYTDYTRGKLGDATRETAPASQYTWDSDYVNFPHSSYYWFMRGGNASYSTSAGVWAVYRSSGGAFVFVSARSGVWVY